MTMNHRPPRQQSAGVQFRPPIRSFGGLMVIGALALVPAQAWADTALVPGAQWTTTVDLPDAWASRADQLAVSVASLDQQENGCLRPELAAGDTSCDADGGDLAALVSATMAAGRYEGGSCVPGTSARPLDLLGVGAVRVDLVGPECVVLTVDFPGSPDDDLAQSDSLGIVLSLVAGGPGTQVEAAVPPVVAGGEDQDGAGSAAQIGPSGRSGASDAGTSGRSGRVVDGPVAGEVVEPSATGSVERPVGQATADVSVGAAGTDVQSESAERLLDDPLALAALLLGTTVLLWLLFVVLRRRRGERA